MEQRSFNGPRPTGMISRRIPASWGTDARKASIMRDWRPRPATVPGNVSDYMGPVQLAGDELPVIPASPIGDAVREALAEDADPCATIGGSYTRDRMGRCLLGRK